MSKSDTIDGAMIHTLFGATRKQSLVVRSEKDFSSYLNFFLRVIFFCLVSLGAGIHLYLACKSLIHVFLFSSCSQFFTGKLFETMRLLITVTYTTAGRGWFMMMVVISTRFFTLMIFTKVTHQLSAAIFLLVGHPQRSER